MMTSIDSNILATLWDEKDAFNARVRDVLDERSGSSRLVISGVVYAELLAAPGRGEDFLDYFLERTEIRVDWQIGEAILRMAGAKFRAYSTRRRRSHSETPRRILADFLIGAHAEVNGFSLLTLDQRLYRAAFPGLTLMSI
jgi:predicted nucleic acid-binding protein